MIPGATLEYVRSRNDALVLTHLRRNSPADRSELADAVGVTPQAVSKILGRLMDEGLVAETGQREAVGRGKPAALHSLLEDSRFALGAAVSQRSLRLALVDLAGGVVEAEEEPLQRGFSPADLASLLGHHVEQMLGHVPAAQDRLVGLGVGIFGPVDHRTGLVAAPHVSREWVDAPLGDILEQRLEMPVLVDRDAMAGMAGQAWTAPDEISDGLFVLAEAGVGAGIHGNDTAHRGAHDRAGELGHTVIDPSGPPCPCGRTGCVEILHETALARGDTDAAARILAIAIVNAVRFIDAERVILAGASIQRAESTYLAAVRRELATAHLEVAVPVSVAARGPLAVCVGAAVEVLESVYGLSAV